MTETSTLQLTLRKLFVLVLTVAILYYAKPFLVPFTFGAILSMLFFPMSRWMEIRGVGRGLSSFLSVLSFVALLAIIISLLSWQLGNMSEELSGIEEKLKGAKDQLQIWLQNKFGVPKERQEQFIKKQQEQGGSSITTFISSGLSFMGSFLVDTILAFVYMFLLLYFRKHLKNFILKVVKPEHHNSTNKIIFESSKVASKYATGMSKMIVILWIMYGIGFSILGVKNAIFFAMLCGLLEIIPFVGNLTGTLLTIIGSVTQDEGSGLILGILITYGIVQFIQTYLLEPLVVGSEENINPLFTIVILVIGELIWGVPGMVLALPLLGIAKVICDHVEPLKPYGFLIGKEKKDNGEGIGKKIKKLFS